MTVVLTNEELTQYVGELSESLNNKIDLGVQNINQQGRSYVSGLPMPSDNYESLALGGQGTQYIAPANGWFVAWSISVNTSAQLYLFNISNQVGFDCWVNAVGVTMRVSCPAKKGDIIVSYDAWIDGNQRNLRFVYAEGETV